MTRQVFPREKIAHLWIHQAQKSARTPTGNFYFSGSTLYSYGSHFVCGHIMPDAYRIEGKPLVVVNAGSYSMTTGRHMFDMCRAIPAARFATVAVNGLCDSDVRDIARSGAYAIAVKLLQSFRAHVADAATPKNVRADKRRASMNRAGDVLAQLRAILQCDIARKDIDKAKRDETRRMLRGLPDSVPTFADDAPSGDIRAMCEQFAAATMRQVYREKMAESLAIFDRNLNAAEAYVVDSAAYAGTWHKASTTLQNLHDAENAARDAAHAAKLSGIKRMPASHRIALKKIPELRAALVLLNNAEKRADALARYAQTMQTTREYRATGAQSWRVAQLVHSLQNLADILACDDTDAERQERAAAIAELQNDAARTASDDVATLLQNADKMQRGNMFADAERQCRLAASRAELIESETVKYGALSDIARMRERIATRLAERNAETERAWRACESSRAPEYSESAGALLRLSRDGSTIETSRGADVPVSVAPMVWRAVNAARDAGETVTFPRESAPRLGHFTLDRIETNGDIVAGCHVIRYAELYGIAKTLGYINAE